MESVRFLLDLYEQTPGSLIFGVQATKVEASKQHLSEIVSACNASLKASQQYFDSTAAWERTKNASKARGEGEAVGLDPFLDKAVSGVHDGAANFTRSLAADHALALVAADFIRRAFPNGPSGITTLAFEDELQAAKDLVKRCDNPEELASHVSKLHLAPFVDALRVQVTAFEAALRKSPPSEITWGKVKAAGAEAQERLAELVAKIAGMFNLRTPEHATARAALLGPIMFQNDRVAQARKFRRPVVDVDPNSGNDVPVTPTEPTTPSGPTQPS